MRIREKQTRTVTVDRELLGLMRVAGGARRRERRMNMTCDICGQRIMEEYFLGGFLKDPPPGSRNLLLHEACVSAQDKARLLKPAAEGKER